MALERTASFAFAGPGGDRLLALSPLQSPSRITRALCGDGSHRVRWIERRPGSAGDTGRRTAANFDRSPGDLFRMVGASAPPDAACLLVGDAFFRPPRPLLRLDPERSPCDVPTRERLAAARERPVTGCRGLATADGGRVVLAEFARRGKDLLASLVLLKDAAEPVFFDYPATHDEERISCWRVDDGCRLDAAALAILFAYRRGGHWGLAVAWDGAEGQALQLLEQDGPGFRELLAGHRYWAPP